MTRSTPHRIRESSVVRRAQLIDEAIDLVGRFGYHGFTIQALATRCAISNAGVLHYFATKDRLLLVVLDEIERRQEDYLAPFVAEALGGGTDTHRATLTLLHSMVERVAAEPGQARFLTALQVESLEPGHPAHDWFRDRESEAIGLLTQLMSDRGEAALLAARHLHALMYGLMLQWLRSGQAFDLVQEWDGVVRLALGQGQAPSPLPDRVSGDSQ